MKKLLFVLSLLIVLFGILAMAGESPPEDLLPIGLTPEEMTRLHEIGINHTRTMPPLGPIRNPSEWEPMQGVIVRYPFGISYSIIAELSEDLMVTTIVANSSEQSTVTSYYNSYGVNLENVDWVIAPTNSIWTRDYGPWFIFDESGDLAIVDPIYNRPRPQDDLIPGVIGDLWGLSVYGMSLATPGGNHMSDGLGMSMSTRLVWDENGSFTHAAIDSIMLAYLGNDYTVMEYIESGGIHHIDCWAKFLNPSTILVKDVPGSWSMHAPLNARAEFLSQQISPWGRPYTIHRVYCPSGTAYTNSIILNNKVFVPTFGQSSDADALLVYQNAMPGYEILGFTGSWLDDDAIHCRTMGVPDSNMLFIHHVPLANQTDTLNDYLLTATIVDHSETGLIADSLKIFYSVSGGAYQSTPMYSSGRADEYYGYIPAQTGAAEVAYYIQAADNSGRVQTHPFIGESWAHQFAMDLPPSMQIYETVFVDSVQPDEATIDTIRVHNGGPGILYISLSSTDSWLGFVTTEQSIPPGDSLDLEIQIDSDGLICGDHTGQIDFVSNDPVNPSGIFEFSLHIYIPELYVSETSITETLSGGDSTIYDLVINNNGVGRLDFIASGQMLQGLKRIAATQSLEIIGYHAARLGKSDPIEPLHAAIDRNSGGPDTFGHFWIDSDDANGPNFDWVDISTTGTSVTLGDDEATVAIPIGFGFPFYDSVYTELYINSNGMVAFDEPITDRINSSLPDTSHTAFIAMFWDDLDPDEGGNIYYYFDDTAETFVVTFDQIKFYYSSSGTGSLTFQIILTPDGNIKFQYGYMYPGLDNLESATIGLQNSEADDAAQIVCNAVYMHSDLAISIYAEHWLSLLSASGSIDPMGSATVNVKFNATDLDAGIYDGFVKIVCNDPNSPTLDIPVTLTVSSQSWVCGDIDGNGSGRDISDLVYLVTYMFSGGPPPVYMGAADIDGSGAGPDIADLVHLVTYMFSGGPPPACP